jgi:hypothetical protein
VANPAEDMVSHIAGLIGSLTAGTNLFASKVRAPRGDVPQDAVFVWASPGRSPDWSMGDVDEIRRPVVTVHVRNSRQKTGSDLIQQVFNTLRGTVPTGYLDMRTNMSSPSDNGYDSDGRHHFSVTFMTPYLET